MTLYSLIANSPRVLNRSIDRIHCCFSSIHSILESRKQTRVSRTSKSTMEAWRNDSMAISRQRSWGLSPRPRVLSHASRFPFTLIFAWLRDLGKISRIGWKRWLSSSYRGICSTYFILKPDWLVTIYRIFINLGSGNLLLVSRKFFFREGNYSRKRENFCLFPLKRIHVGVISIEWNEFRRKRRMFEIRDGRIFLEYLTLSSSYF